MGKNENRSNNPSRDIITASFNAILLPWSKMTDIDPSLLPKTTLKELSRRTGLKASKIAETIGNQTFSVTLGGQKFVTALSKDSQSVQLVLPKIQQVDQGNTVTEYDVMEELEVPLRQRTETVEEIAYREPQGRKIMNVMEWMKKVGAGRNWIYQNNEVGMALNLAKLARGELVDFPIWNCIGFEWVPDKNGEMPFCNITNNLDAAIVVYFAKKIEETSRVLASIGNPNIKILIPSNEALNKTGVWKYKQSEDERENILNETVSGLTSFSSKLSLPSACSLEVKRWDNYLISAGAKYSSDYYSQQGVQRLRESSNFGKVVKEGVKSGLAYFAQNGVTNIDKTVLEKREIGYYGIYSGEGVFYEEAQEAGRGIVILNFEEMRVSQMSFVGARGDLVIATPISSEQMTAFYQWEKAQIAKRKKYEK